MARRAVNWLSSTAISPNQISFASIVAGLLALASCAAAPLSDGGVRAALYLVAALACQLRLLCNLLDGMLAIEAGKSTRNGAFWNEVPDRIADISILFGIGIATQWPSLGWTAAALAVFVAYLRELGKGIDGVVDFRGPMAKQHRMALMTVALLLAGASDLLPVDEPESLQRQILTGALWLCIAGCVTTLYRRSKALLNRLQ